MDAIGLRVSTGTITDPNNPIASEQKISHTTGGLPADLSDADGFGNDVAFIGDLDGDGISELAVGIPFDDDGSSNSGAIQILFLNADGTVKSEMKTSSLNFVSGDNWGWSLSKLGDLDGDGIPDLAVGAPFDDDGGAGGNSGAIWILFLNSNGVIKSTQKISDTAGNFGALVGNDHFGTGIDNLGDLDGDGVIDLVVGAENRNTIYVLFLNANGTVKGYQEIGAGIGGFTGPVTGSTFGADVANLGDVDGDGVTDIAVGARQYHDGSGYVGSIWVLFMNANGTVKGEKHISNSLNGFTGTLTNPSSFGYGMAGTGDMNSDGIPDVAVGRPDATPGEIWLLMLDSDGTVKEHKIINETEGGFTGPLAAGGDFGFGIDVPANLNSNASFNFAVGNRYDNDGGTDRGAVWVMDLSLIESGGGSTSMDFASLPLTDNYDPTLLEYASSSVTPDSVNTSTGELFWDDVNEETPITVTFVALEPSFNNESTDNMVCSSGAVFVDGKTMGTVCDTASVSILSGGSFSGYIWSDVNANGWQGTTGYDGGDLFIAGVSVSLYSCTSVANNGSCNGIETVEQTVVSDENGAYSFVGLVSNLHYKVVVETGTLPGSPSQTGDPDDNPIDGSGNGGTCGNGGANAGCNNEWDNDDDWFELGVDTWGSESWDVANINFAYTIDPVIYGTVWEDVDGDGNQDTGEEGISGVTVNLVDPISLTVTPAVTDANGDFRYAGLISGRAYTFAVLTNTLPSSGTWTETYESDGTINNTITQTLFAGEVSGPHEFAFTQSGGGIIGDLVYVDADGDGIYNNSDELLSNVPVYLYKDNDNNGVIDSNIDSKAGSTTTNANGFYSFTNVAMGYYIVLVDDNALPSFFKQTGDPDEDGTTCTTCDNQGLIQIPFINTGNYLDLDFGYYPEMGITPRPNGDNKIGDQVWLDENADGIQSGAFETGIPYISVELWADLFSDGNYVLTTTDETDIDGFYLFENLPDGNYEVRVDDTDSNLPQDAFGNSYGLATTSSYPAIISGGIVTSLSGNACTNCNLDADFGFYEPASFSGLVFWDANGDAEQGWGETAIGDVTVYLKDSLGVVIETTSTSDGTGRDSIGVFAFDKLYPGEYTVQVESTDPELLGATLTADPSSDGVPCTDPSAVGCDHEYTAELSNGTNVSWANFGYQPAGVLGDFVWEDVNSDGVQDDSEIGLPKTTVTAINQTTVIVDGISYPIGTYSEITYTDYDGYYSFDNLVDGSWKVTVLSNAGYSATYDPDGGNDNVTIMVISGGIVSSVGNAWCTNSDCSLDIDFGLKESGSFSISGTVCIDDGSNDGICSTGGETDLEGYYLSIYNLNGELKGQVKTDAFGDYTFKGLSEGTYFVAIPTNQVPLEFMILTTMLGDTPAASIINTAASVYQKLVITANVIGLDFAFVYDVNYDLGDLPLPYQTLMNGSTNGPVHILPTTPYLYMGNTVDAETTITLDSEATGDNLSGTDDEDGVTFSDTETWVIGTAGGLLDLSITGTGWLVAFADFSQDGDFNDAGEMIFDQGVTTGSQTLSFDIPSGTDISGGQDLYFRFRLFNRRPFSSATASASIVEGGEVEDYKVGVCRNLSSGGQIEGDEQDCTDFDPTGIFVVAAPLGGGGYSTVYTMRQYEILSVYHEAI